VTDYTRLGDVLARKRNWREALNTYNEAVRVAEVILSKDPNSIRWRNNVGSLNTKRGDVLVTWWNEVMNRPDAPELLFTSAALERYGLAAQNYESLLDSQAPPYHELFGVRLKIADVLVRQKKFDQALGAYDSASEIAQKAAATWPVTDWQIALSKSLEEAGDFLARESSSGAQLAGNINALVYYGKALDSIQSAASKGPDNSQIQSRTAALTAKIKSQQSAAQ
jgi:tetratricopeptide (TPR) repeat protein